MFLFVIMIKSIIERVFSMGILQPYQGRFVNAPSASNQLDINKILIGCSMVEEEANHISEFAGNIMDATSVLDVRNFSVDNETILDDAAECCNNIGNVEKQIMDLTAQIREAVEISYNNIQQQLNYDAHARDEYECRRR